MLIILRWLAVAFTVFALTVSTLYVSFGLRPKVYTAASSLSKMRKLEPTSGKLESYGPTEFQADFETIKSPKVLLTPKSSYGQDVYGQQ